MFVNVQVKFLYKARKKSYPSGRAYNLLSPPLNQKTKPKQFLNGNIPRNQPIALYSAYLSPSQNDKTLSVKNISSPDDKLSQDLLNKFSNYQENLKGKMFLSPNTRNSDLLTVGSLTTQQSESILSNNTNTNTYIPTTFQPYINNYAVCQFPNHRYNYSMTNYPQMNCFYSNNHNPFLNGNYINMNMRYNNRQSANMVQKKNNQNTNYNKTNTNKYKKKSSLNYNKTKSNSNNNDEKIDVSNFNSNNSIKSGSGSDKSNTDSNKLSSNNNSNSNKSDSINGKNEKTNSNLPRKKYYNKFNSPKENNITNENTVILTLKIKVAPNDFRTFNLKKYDDLFISLEKFFDLNKIKQDLVKPIVTKIFAALNKIFWLLNNKIGIYDQEYLNSLHKLWIKNNGQIPKRNVGDKSKDEDAKSNNSKDRDKKNKANSDKSTISSSDSTDGDKKHKKIMSNSFQNMDNSSEDAKENSINSI